MSYPQSTMVGCFCLDAVVTSIEDHGIVKGAKVVASEQGAICSPFLKDYATANAIKIFAVKAICVFLDGRTLISELEIFPSVGGTEGSGSILESAGLAPFLLLFLQKTTSNTWRIERFADSERG